MRDLAIHETFLASGGDYEATKVGAAVGGVIGGIMIFPIAAIMGTFAGDSPYAHRSNTENVFWGITMIGAGAGAAVLGGVGFAVDSIIYLLVPTAQ